MKNWIEDRMAGFILIIGILGSAISVITFTSISYFSCHFNRLGQIGDTIGGLTAPIIGILNATLLWLTLRRQASQIKDQKVSDAIDRKSAVIREEIQTIYIKIHREEEDTLDLAGESRGHLAVVKVSALFSNQQLSNYDINPATWRVFSHEVYAILMIAQDLLIQNFTSNRDFDEKLSVYRLTISQILPIVVMFETINRFKSHNPIINGLPKFDLSSYEEFIVQQFFLKYEPI